MDLTRIRTHRWIGAVLIATLVPIHGCAPTTLQPPPMPEDPVTIAVLDHGRHASLVLPAAPDSGADWIRYSYGDWSYYVERRTNPFSGLIALLVPSRAALGRQPLSGPDLPTALESGLRISLVEWHPLEVAAEPAEMLLDKLETLWKHGQDSRFDAPTWGMSFVEHPDDYSLRHNSNQMVVYWLELMDVSASRRPILSNWQVEPVDPSLQDPE